MRPFFLTLLAASAVLISASSSVGTAAEKKIVVGLDDNFPPMGFSDDAGKLIGFDIDMAREAAKRMGIEAEFRPIDWGAKEAELKGGRVDLLWNGLTITEARKQVILFSKPYMENHQIIVVKTGSPITNKAGLAKRIVGLQDGSSAVEAVQADQIHDSIAEIKRYGDNVTALMDLTIGRLDAVVVDEVVGRYYVSKKPDAYAILTEDFGTEEYGVGLRKDDVALLEKLQAALDAMKKDGTSAAIAKQWFGKDIIK
ncbi:amino acid ABC transporter substrate-binding protein [Alphaproteobacteria bacterium]|nr:amino acid ABC transporter substrate-binding protein [Alphaproteobacteria bacterium]